MKFPDECSNLPWEIKRFDTLIMIIFELIVYVTIYVFYINYKFQYNKNCQFTLTLDAYMPINFPHDIKQSWFVYVSV